MVKTWNQELRTQAQGFGREASQANVTFFSSNRILSKVLDQPEEYDFSETDVTDENGAIWVDELHLSEDVHRILAEEVVRGTNIEAITAQ